MPSFERTIKPVVETVIIHLTKKEAEDLRLALRFVYPSALERAFYDYQSKMLVIQDVRNLLTQALFSPVTEVSNNGQ